MKTEDRSVAIIGAGITGLTAAYVLQQRGIACTVYEATDRVGGCIRTEQEDGWMVECGPNTILDTHPDIGRLITALNLGDEKRAASSASNKRFIVRGGKPIALPSNPPTFFLSKAFSLRAKLRLMCEPLIRSKATDTESLADFVVRRLGQEFLDYAINPFIGGIYAGDPAQLSTRYAFPKLYALEQDYRSLIVGAFLGAYKRRKRAEIASKDARMFTFADGMETLTQRLAERLGNTIQRNTPINAIEKTTAGKWRIANALYSDVLLALPTHAMTQINTPFDLSPLKPIFYPAVTSLSLGFDAKQFTHPLDGFGMLIPQIEARYSLGALFPSSIFPNRAPAGKVLLTVFIGGALTPERALQSEEELLAGALGDLEGLLGLTGKPEYTHMSVWPHAIPQYNLGYETFLNHMNQLESENHGLHFGGHYRDGIAVGNSILAGLKAGERIANK